MMPAMRIGPTEINAGLMALDAHWARWALDRVQPEWRHRRALPDGSGLDRRRRGSE